MMKKLALGLGTAATFGAITIGLAGPAMAAPDDVVPGREAVDSTQSDGPVIRPVDCSVHVNYQGSNVDVNWC